MKKIKSAMCLLLGACMLIGQFKPVQAEEIKMEVNADTYSNQRLSNKNEVELEDYNVSVIMEDIPTGRQVTVKHNDNGIEEVYTYDSVANELHSSVTDTTIELGDVDSSDILGSSSISYKYISWAQINAAVGATGNAISIASCVAAICGVEVPLLVGMISTAMGVGTYAIPSDTNHGLKVTIKTTKYYRTRMGRRQVYKITHTVTGVSKY